MARDFATSYTPERRAFDVTWKGLETASCTLAAAAETSDHKIVGYLLAHIHPTFLANDTVAWVEEVMVAESHRRSGVGRGLMDHAETWARESNAAYIALASRRAGPFYLALGYDDSAVIFKKSLA